MRELNYLKVVILCHQQQLLQHVQCVPSGEQKYIFALSFLLNCGIANVKFRQLFNVNLGHLQTLRKLLHHLPELKQGHCHVSSCPKEVASICMKQQVQATCVKNQIPLFMQMGCIHFPGMVIVFRKKIIQTLIQGCVQLDVNIFKAHLHVLMQGRSAYRSLEERNM